MAGWYLWFTSGGVPIVLIRNRLLPLRSGTCILRNSTNIPLTAKNVFSKPSFAAVPRIKKQRICFPEHLFFDRTNGVAYKLVVPNVYVGWVLVICDNSSGNFLKCS